MFNLLDVAVGPILLYFGIGIVLGVGALLVIIVYSVRAIQKIKADRDSRE